MTLVHSGEKDALIPSVQEDKPAANVQAVAEFVGLKCDAPGCGWADMTIGRAEYEGYRNAPCPDCGSNVLDDADWEMVLRIEAAMAWATENADALGLSIAGPQEPVELSFGGSGKVTIVPADMDVTP